jgi:hypothetical protein
VTCSMGALTMAGGFLLCPSRSTDSFTCISAIPIGRCANRQGTRAEELDVSLKGLIRDHLVDLG